MGIFLKRVAGAEAFILTESAPFRPCPVDGHDASRKESLRVAQRDSIGIAGFRKNRTLVYIKITTRYMRRVLCLTWSVFVLCSCEHEKTDSQDTAVKDDVSQFALTCAPEVVDRSWYTSGKTAPLFDGLEGIHFPVSTKNAKAQQYFDQGLMLSYGFNHAEAARSFHEAARQDSTCAMCWWGFAYVLGPNYNGGMEKDNFPRAYDAAQKARSLSANCTQKEKDLIEALAGRYSKDANVSRSLLDSVFASVMRKVHDKYPSDVDIASLFAESLMDQHPWDLWNKDGTMKPWTPEIMTTLRKALKQAPRHAGANHFFIHATEMSSKAESAVGSADLLMDLVPGSGHLLHMPSHTYIRMGRYHDGVVANRNAVLVDSMYTVACHAQGVYPLAYYPHNHHFLSACAVLSGESKPAMEGALQTARHAHSKLLRDPAWATLQHYYSIPWYVQVKLGLWGEILKSSAPEKDLKYPSVIWLYARGMAQLSRDNLPEAKRQLADMKAIMTDTTIRDLTIWGINSVFDLCVIASKTLEAEIFAKEKNHPAAIALLQEAVATEDALNYNEPPDWFFSVRHHLGAVLLEAGRYRDAVKVYEEDLKTYRENGWALKGLMNAYAKLNDKPNLERSRRRFEEAWKHADVAIGSSRIL
jgi:tetratricopeptide (TPR) repeat protein